jgi:hypothetical protein
MAKLAPDSIRLESAVRPSSAFAERPSRSRVGRVGGRARAWLAVADAGGWLALRSDSVSSACGSQAGARGQSRARRRPPALIALLPT